MSVGRRITATLAVIAVLVGGWFSYWFIARESVENRYEVNTGTQQYQSALISQQRDRAAAYDLSSDEAQKTNIATTFCAVYQELTQPPADLVQANARIC